MFNAGLSVIGRLADAALLVFFSYNLVILLPVNDGLHSAHVLLLDNDLGPFVDGVHGHLLTDVPVWIVLLGHF